MSAGPDTDGDLVDDAFDNCLVVRNGPNEMSNQVDTDGDGFGNACDADFNQDGVVSLGDSGPLTCGFDMPHLPVGLVYDLDGDGYCTINDVAILFYYQVTGGPGP